MTATCLLQPSECRQLARSSGRVAFAVPGDLDTPTGGYRYDRRIIEELRRLGWQVDVLNLGNNFPFPNRAQRSTALVMLSAVPEGLPNCSRWACLWGAPRGRRAPISHAACRPGAPTACSGIQS